MSDASSYYSCTKTDNYAARCWKLIFVTILFLFAIPIIGMVVCHILLFTVLCYSSRYLPIAANASKVLHIHRKYLTSTLKNKVDRLVWNPAVLTLKCNTRQSTCKNILALYINDLSWPLFSIKACVCWSYCYQCHLTNGVFYREIMGGNDMMISSDCIDSRNMLFTEHYSTGVWYRYYIISKDLPLHLKTTYWM